jgi:hypothetical protein
MIGMERVIDSLGYNKNEISELIERNREKKTWYFRKTLSTLNEVETSLLRE